MQADMVTVPQTRRCTMTDRIPIELPPWLEQLRQSEIVERVRKDPRSIAGKMLGVDYDVATKQVAGWGQAEFDEPWNNLSPDDRVLLYAYFFQQGHLEELTEAFRMLFADTRPDEPVVVDLGCGPFTGGLAVAGALGQGSRFDYIGVDRSRTMCRFGEQLASAAARFDDVPRVVRHWTTDVSTVSWDRAPGWRPVIVIVSYLLASPTLDAVALVDELDGLLKRIGRGPVTALYTNSIRPEANRSFPDFCTALRDAGFELYADDSGKIEIDRWAGTRIRELRYALFHRRSQNTLPLGRD